MATTATKTQWAQRVINCEAEVCFCQQYMIAGLRKIGERIYIVHDDNTMSTRCSFRYRGDISPEMEAFYNGRI